MKEQLGNVYISPLVFSVVRVGQSVDFYVLLCRPLLYPRSTGGGYTVLPRSVLPSVRLSMYKNQLSRQTGSRNLTGPTTLLTIWHTYMKLVTKYQISPINSC